MSVIINSEHFELPLDARAKIERKLEKLNRILPQDSNLRLFLKTQGKGLFTAILSVHVGHKDFVASASGNQLIALVNATESFLRRRLIAMNQKRIDRRRHAVHAG